VSHLLLSQHLPGAGSCRPFAAVPNRPDRELMTAFTTKN